MNHSTTTTVSSAERDCSRPHNPHAGPAPASARLVKAMLHRMSHGQLQVHWPDGSTEQFGGSGGPSAILTVDRWSALDAAVRSGDIGFAEAYIRGDWHSPDLVALLQVLAANRSAIDRLLFGHWALRAMYRVRHWLNRNTKTNSRKNIHAHYDLGNAFYRLWLDPSMNYSSAWFQNGAHTDLTTAQHAKVRRALTEAGVQPGHRVLEIGCGWGALAEMATAERGAQVTGVTLSTEQLAYAQDRLAQRGLASKADLRLQDYRDIDDAPFDAICSIEMIEAVGQAYWPSYFGTVSRLLKPGGRACIQSIVIRDDLFERYLRSTDFIQQYIFPGGCLPCPQEVRQQAANQGLTVVNELAFGLDYAQTCKLWREQFLAVRDQVQALGFDERFMRTWAFYLAYCEAGFRVGDIDVVQYTLQKT